MSEAEANPKKTWVEFLEGTPPDSVERVSGACGRQGVHWVAATPDIRLHCESESCGGIRTFCSSSTVYVSFEKWINGFLFYSCRNCQKTEKTYSVSINQNGKDGTSAWAFKFGENPPFGPPTPARVITLIGPDRETFLRGRRAENHGLGIGAFAYYRRVVENQKGRIIAQIAKVARKLGAEEKTLALFEEAASETQFSKAIDLVRTAIPQVLLIDGQHNPLTLLHTALSEGLHDHSDEECLELAQDIRVVLSELAERMSLALKEEDALKHSVARLLGRKETTPE
jgi:hypothetical protein